MGDLNSLVRQSRFDFTPGLKLVVETSTGSQLTLDLLNGSISGIGAKCTDTSQPLNEIEHDSILTASKIVAGTTEHFLGRLAVKRVENTEGGTYLALATIDTKVPVHGFLSRYIAGSLSERKSPYEFELSPTKFNTGSFESIDLGNVDLFYRAEQFDIFMRDLKVSPRYQYNNVRLPSHGERIILDKTRPDARNDYIVMGSNDYLGLANHPKVIEATKEALQSYGFGSTGSAMTTGLSKIHESLCKKLALIFKQEDAMLFNSGYGANVGIISGITQANDLVIADFLSHASIHDGLRMSNADVRLFKHNDLKHLERLLAEHRESHAGCLIVTEGVFSMDGDTPPLEEILQLASRYNARVLVDEAHSFGVIGPNGLGCWETCHKARPDLIMGTFSKVCGGIGGFVTGPTKVIEWLKWHARSYIFSVSIPPSTAAAALAALDILENDRGLVAKLKSNISHFVKGLRNIGYPIEEGHQSAVIPVVIGNDKKLGLINGILRDRGVFVIPITYPAVSRNNSRFRFTIMSNHSTSDLDFVLEILNKAFRQADIKF